MPAQWTAELIGTMHTNRIKQNELAAHMGFTPEYVCKVLNGKRAPKKAEQKFRAALNELIARKEEATPCNTQ